MNSKQFSLIALGSLTPLSWARADLTADLIAYYNFEATDSAGIANQVGGGATHNGSYGSGTTYDVTPAIAGTGAGFAGDAAYAGAEPGSTTDRSVMLVGNSLNVAKDDLASNAGSGWFNVPTLDSATLGSSFAISAWFFLQPDADNSGADAAIFRDYVFESADLDNFDVSFGTSDATGTTFVSWIGGTSGAQNAGTLAPGQWHHVVHVFSPSGANTALDVYVNGVKVGATVSTATANMNFTSLNFGAARTGIRVFDGMLDEVGVWGRSLTANDVTELYQRGTESLALTADLAAASKAFVRVESSDPLMGQTFGSGLYDLNEVALIEAEPALGHLFNGWGTPYEGQPDEFNLTVTASKTIIANFVQDTADDDGDGLTNYQELVVYFTVPTDPDTDNDLIEDGDEVENTLTSPLVSQLAAVNYIIANLGGGAGPGDTVLTRNEANNTLTVRVMGSTSTTLAAWSDLTPASPGITAGNSFGDFELQVPGTADPKRFFRMEGVQP
jgi:hypothetical protein